MKAKKLIELAWNKFAAAKDAAKTLSGAASVQELRALRADQEQLNLALAVRLKDLQVSAEKARSDSSDALKVAREAAADAKAALGELDRVRRELEAALASARRAEADLRTADSRRAEAALALAERQVRSERRLSVMAVVVAVLLVLVAWLAVRGLA